MWWYELAAERLTMTLTVILMTVMASLSVSLPRWLKRHRPCAMIHPVPDRYTFPSLSFRGISQPQLTALWNFEPFAVPIQISRNDVELL
jgi:hypothetical protein